MWLFIVKALILYLIGGVVACLLMTKDLEENTEKTLEEINGLLPYNVVYGVFHILLIIVWPVFLVTTIIDFFNRQFRIVKVIIYRWKRK